MEIVYAFWWALIMTFGVLPGACLIAYMFECGNRKGAFRYSGLKKLYREAIQAKRIAIRETADLLIPRPVPVGAVILYCILLLIRGDTLMLAAVNGAAVPISLFSYYQGEKLRKAHGYICIDRQDPKFEEKLRHATRAIDPYFFRIASAWLVLSVGSLLLLYVFGL
jgi:hypothetical protein